ncbi:MAG TPA: APC family permease [Candidatus Binatia bacterium]|jgi:amino acid transporter
METDRPAARKFIVPVTAMLSFISFWRAAAIVLSDLGSSAYYVGGIAEQAIGKAAPWFILAIMLFSYAVRAVYIESCSMFVRGGVYRVVREAMGSAAAKFSVSALLFDYVLTGPISAVSAGLYLAGLINESGGQFGISWMKLPSPFFAVVFAIVVTLYFWRSNRIGIPFSSTKALRIMQVTTVMVVLLIAWCLVTIFLNGYQPVPAPTPDNLAFSDEALGWLAGTAVSRIAVIAILIGLGHSLLAMSGEESLAQVYREIEAPKHQSLVRTGFVVFVYSLVFTSLVSFFAVMIIPDGVRSRYFDNLISGLSMFLAGPAALKVAFHGFVVLVGTLILSGAVNTAIIGSNGVLNRVAEDGVLPEWFRDPHKKHGTTHRIINLIVGLQLLTIVITRGNVYLLGEAYAFGVAWSFAMKALAVTVLRFKAPRVKRWKVPLNFRAGGIEIPVGLGLITLVLFSLAVINMLTKETATIAGVTFTIAFFVAFSLSEKYHAPKKTACKKTADSLDEGEIERFRFELLKDLSPPALKVRPGNILVAAQDPDPLRHLEIVLEKVDTKQVDVVVLSVNRKPADGAGESADDASRIVDDCATLVFSRVVHVAEKIGKPVSLVAVAGEDSCYLVLEAAQNLRSARVVLGPSSRDDAPARQEEIRRAWERLPAPQPSLTVEIAPDDAGRTPLEIHLGPDLTQFPPADARLVAPTPPRE